MAAQCTALAWPRAGSRGAVNLTMPPSAWLGQFDGPHEVPDYSPADADTCRDLATWLAHQSATRWCPAALALPARIRERIAVEVHCCINSLHITQRCTPVREYSAVITWLIRLRIPACCCEKLASWW